MTPTLLTVAAGLVLLTGSFAASGCDDGGGSDALVLFDGDSLTAGYLVDAAESYPAKVARALPGGVLVRNVAVSGQTWPELLADAAEEVDGAFSETRRRNIVVVWAAANDLATGFTGEEAAANARRYCEGRRRAGYTVVLLTMFPLQPPEVDPDYERQRLAYNALLRREWRAYADALVDVAGDERLGDSSGPERAEYFLDVVHLDAAGYEIVAELVTPVVEELIEEDGR